MQPSARITYFAPEASIIFCSPFTLNYYVSIKGNVPYNILDGLFLKKSMRFNFY